MHLTFCQRQKRQILATFMQANLSRPRHIRMAYFPSKYTKKKDKEKLIKEKLISCIILMYAQSKNEVLQALKSNILQVSTLT